MYNILICDDEKDIVSALKIYLASENYNIFEANNGKEALDVIECNDIHLVLMDIMMPVMDGITATKEIRKIESERTIPGQERVKIIAITANAFEDDRSKFFEAGMDFYMNKPVEINELHRLLSI